VTNATVPAAVLSFIAAIAILLLSRLEHSRSVQPSLLNIYLLASLVFDAVQNRTLYLRHDTTPLLCLLTIAIDLKGLLLLLEASSKRRYSNFHTETTRRRRPAAFSVALSFGGSTQYFFFGDQKPLDLEWSFQTDQALLSKTFGDLDAKFVE
jgi:ATP-binding cassette subfamily C (CFTR/MRP) protein 1